MEGLRFLKQQNIVEEICVPGAEPELLITEKFNQHVIHLLKNESDYLDDVLDINDMNQISKFTTRAMMAFTTVADDIKSVSHLSQQTDVINALYALTALLSLNLKKAYDEKTQISKMSLRQIKWG